MTVSINGKSNLGQMFNASLEAAKKRPGNKGETSNFEKAVSEGFLREIGGNGYNIQFQDIDNDGVKDLTGFPSLEELQENWFINPDSVTYEEIINEDGSVSYKFSNNDFFELTYNENGELISVEDPSYSLSDDWVNLDSNYNASMDLYYDQETFKISDSNLLTIHHRDDKEGFTDGSGLYQIGNEKPKIFEGQEQLDGLYSQYWLYEE